MTVGLKQYSQDAQRLDLNTFVKRHGEAFLVRSSVDGNLDKPTQPAARTSTVNARHFHEAREAKGAFYVYPITSRGNYESPGRQLFVGRVPARDIQILDVSVSKLHAELRRCPDGEYEIVDRGSANGTTIAGKRLTAWKPARLEFGKTVQLGRVRLTYLPAAQFVDYVRTLEA